MFPIFLAVVIFSAAGDVTPKLVGVFRNADDCWVEARKQNSALERSDPLHQPDRGFVCLKLIAEI